jgi:hypothetical protein
MEELTILDQLRDKGALDDKEYSIRKRQLIDRLTKTSINATEVFIRNRMRQATFFFFKPCR